MHGMNIKVVCGGCNGTGKTIMPRKIEVTCPFCQGKGYENKNLYIEHSGLKTCYNSKCKHYYEAICTYETSGNRITIGSLGECTNFEIGVNEGYEEDGGVEMKKREYEKIIETGVDLGDGEDSAVEITSIEKGDDVIIIDIKKIK